MILRLHQIILYCLETFFLNIIKIKTINNQIRDEKLQYNINREADEVSALSSDKVYKQEYLTGEDILPCNKQQIIEKDRFTYFSLGKAFEKQLKTVGDKGEKQIKAIQDQGQVKRIKQYAYDAEDTPLILKQKEIVNELVDKRLEEITNLDKNNLTYKYKGNTADGKFDKFDNALNIIKKIQNGEISLADVNNNQEKFKSYLGEMKKGNKKT